MRRNFNLAKAKKPRVIMRVLIGGLLAANLAAAILAFHPFGGSAEDLRREQQQLNSELARLRSRVALGKRLVDKVQGARTQGESFMGLYFMSADRAAALIAEDLDRMRSAAGIKMGQASFSTQAIEGSDSLVMESIQVGFEGSYANFVKFINLVDKSPRFLVIESLNAAAPQGQGQAGQPQAGQALNVTLKIDAFIRDVPGAA